MERDAIIFSILLKIEDVCSDVNERIQRREGTASDYEESFRHIDALLIIAITRFESMKQNREISELSNSFISECISDGVEISLAYKRWKENPTNDFFSYMYEYTKDEPIDTDIGPDDMANKIAEEWK